MVKKNKTTGLKELVMLISQSIFKNYFYSTKNQKHIFTQFIRIPMEDFQIKKVHEETSIWGIFFTIGLSPYQK